MFKGKLKIKQ